MPIIDGQAVAREDLPEDNRDEDMDDGSDTSDSVGGMVPVRHGICPEEDCCKPFPVKTLKWMDAEVEGFVKQMPLLDQALFYRDKSKSFKDKAKELKKTAKMCTEAANYLEKKGHS